MARKGGWFSAVKKVLSSDSKKDQKNHKLNTKWFGEPTDLEPASSFKEEPLAVAPPLPSIDTNEENEKSKHERALSLKEVPFDTAPSLSSIDTDEENEKNKDAYSVALATDIAAEDVVPTAQAAAEDDNLTSVPYYPEKTKEEIAATKIQMAFRGYLARRALHELRRLVRLKSLIQGHSVKRQAATTLRSMQTLARVQSQTRKRRIRMSEENQALQWQLKQKHENEHNNLQAAVGEEWDDSVKSKEQIEAKMLDRKEAAMRREKARAYALSHQQTWKNPSKSVNTKSKLNNPFWDWSWLERWMSSQPWKSQSTMDHNDLASVKCAPSSTMSVGEIIKLYSLRDLNHGNKPSTSGQKSSRPPAHPSPLTPAPKVRSSPSASEKPRPPSWKGNANGSDDDLRSKITSRSQHNRRHSIAGSSVRDDEIHVSSKSPKVKSRTQRPPSPVGNVSAISVKKQLSFPSSASLAGSKRHSCPPEVEIFSKKDIAAITGEEK